MIEDKDIFTLHRYFIWADRMRVHFDAVLNDNRLKGKASQMGVEEFLYLSCWYGLLYVVIEGWNELQLRDNNIAQLLQSENVVLLRRYRNGIFHFQRDYYSEKVDAFWSSPYEPVKWVRELHSEFSRFFLQWIDRREK